MDLNLLGYFITCIDQIMLYTLNLGNAISHLYLHKIGKSIIAGLLHQQNAAFSKDVSWIIPSLVREVPWAVADLLGWYAPWSTTINENSDHAHSCKIDDAFFQSTSDISHQ